MSEQPNRLSSKPPASRRLFLHRKLARGPSPSGDGGIA